MTIPWQRSVEQKAIWRREAVQSEWLRMDQWLTRLSHEPRGACTFTRSSTTCSSSDWKLNLGLYLSM
jgi:hypothetical protein